MPNDIPEKPVNGWSFQTLLQYVLSIFESNDRRYTEMFAASDKAVATALASAEKGVNAALAAAEKAVAAALTAADKATMKAEESQLRVNEGQNEFRQQLKDQASTFVSRDVLEAVVSTQRAAHDALVTRLAMLEKANSSNAGEDKGKGIVVAYVMAALAILVSLMSAFGQFLHK